MTEAKRTAALEVLTGFPRSNDVRSSVFPSVCKRVKGKPDQEEQIQLEKLLKELVPLHEAVKQTLRLPAGLSFIPEAVSSIPESVRQMSQDAVHQLKGKRYSQLNLRDKFGLSAVGVQYFYPSSFTFTVHLGHEAASRRAGDGGEESLFTFKQKEVQHFSKRLRYHLKKFGLSYAALGMTIEISDTNKVQFDGDQCGQHVHAFIGFGTSVNPMQRQLLRMAIRKASQIPRDSWYPQALKLDPWDHENPAGWGHYITKKLKPKPKAESERKPEPEPEPEVYLSAGAERLGKRVHSSVITPICEHWTDPLKLEDAA